MSNLEEYLLETDCILADDKFISDGFFMIKKDYLKSKALRCCKNKDNLFDLSGDIIPFERGIEYDCTSVGIRCELLPHNEIGIYYNEKYCFNYDKVKMLIKQIPFWQIACFYVVENKQGQPLLKIFVNDEFVACLMAMQKTTSSDVAKNER